MASPKAVRAEQSIDSTCRKLKLSEAGKRWLDYALDPFKDCEERDPAGFPDLNTAKSVVQVVNQSINVATTSGGANWDCNIFLDGIMNTQNLRSTTYLGGGWWQRAGQGVTDYLIGGVCVRQDVSGTPLYLPTTTQSSPVPANFLTGGQTRIVGVGIEVINTTATLNKQGNLVVWRAPDSVDGEKVSAMIVNDPALVTTNSVSYPRHDMPTIPETQAAALLLPGL
jgi:hypothetical protein